MIVAWETEDFRNRLMFIGGGWVEILLHQRRYSWRGVFKLARIRYHRSIRHVEGEEQRNVDEKIGTARIKAC